MINVQGVDMFDSNDNTTQDQGAADTSGTPPADIFSGSDATATPSADTPADSSAPFGAPSVLTNDDSSTPSTDADTHDAAAPATEEAPAPTETESPAKEDDSSSATKSDSGDKDHDAVMTTAPSEDLTAMKQEALGHLQPLVAHLDLSPEEEFRTTMMMIQANDDQSLLSKAFEAAKKISDDKARAQALLDVINEINYFTQHAE